MKTSASLPVIACFSLLSLPATGQDRPSDAGGKAPPGYVIVEEEVLYDLPENYPDQPMKAARKYLGKKDYQAAARETRKVEAFLKAERTRSDVGNDSALDAGIDDLEKIASKLEAESAIPEKELKDSFARAHLALAASDQAKASENFAAKEARRAGQEMKAGAKHVEKAAEWSGTKLDHGAKAAVKGSLELSGKLLEGAGWVPEEVGKGIHDLGSEIDRLGQKLRTSKPAEGSASR